MQIYKVFEKYQAVSKSKTGSSINVTHHYFASKCGYFPSESVAEVQMTLDSGEAQMASKLKIKMTFLED